MRIFLDMDEVLVDFTGGVCQLFGITRDQLEQRRHQGRWNIPSYLGDNVDEDEMWRRVHNLGSAFWQNLQPLPWAGEFTKYIGRIDCNYHVVTSPSRCHTSYVGKVLWAQANPAIVPYNRLFICKNKHYLANKDTVLIDDKLSNVKKFMDAGGCGILFPSNGNELYAYADDPVHYVTYQLRELSLSTTRARSY